MQVKRFVAANMRLALKMVREEIGPDAVILSNKRVAGGVELLTAVDETVDPTTDETVGATASTSEGASLNPFEQAAIASAQAAQQQQTPSVLDLELDRMQAEAQQRAQALSKILAEKKRLELEQAHNAVATPSLDNTEPPLAADVVSFSSMMAAATNDGSMVSTPESDIQSGSVQSNAPTIDNSAAKNNDTAKQQFVAERDDELASMRFELQSMRELLERQLSSMAWGQFTQQHPQQAGLWKRLKRMGIGATIAESLLASSYLANGSVERESAEIWQSIMSDLCERVPVVGEDLLVNGGVFAFVGPTGAGKTTTIGKLAARYVLKNGADDLALVTTDTMRIAAHEQLRTFGRILNVPVKIVDKNNSLERVLHSLRHKALVLVDTAGLNRQDQRLKPQLRDLNEVGSRLRTIMVIPTTSQVEVIKSAYHTYKTDSLSGCVLTKLDESACLGEALTLTIEKQLPIAYITDGQGVPEDIAIADGPKLVRSAIDLAKHTTTNDESMAEEMATLS